MEDEDDRRARARVGTVLDEKWTLERLLGTGGMAAVYAARHRNGARAAVKILHPALARLKEVRERFQREGYAANRVGHPGVVKVLDDDVVENGPDGGTAYLVMELLEGESLQDRIERGPPVGELETLRLAYEVLDVLREAHDRGVVHRDLKPENLFLVGDVAPGPDPGERRVKVLDFGLARLLQGQPITTYGLALGTPSFMSPEQAAGRLDEIDGRTDLFALGATAFRLRTGRRIHDGANAVELVRKMAHSPAPPIGRIAPDVSKPFARVVDRALEFRREDRYPSAHEMQADVARAIAELEAPALVPAEPVARALAPVATALPLGAVGALPGFAGVGRPGVEPDSNARTVQVTTGDLEPSVPRADGVDGEGEPDAAPALAARRKRGRAAVAVLATLIGAAALAVVYAVASGGAPAETSAWSAAWRRRWAPASTLPASGGTASVDPVAPAPGASAGSTWGEAVVGDAPARGAEGGVAADSIHDGAPPESLRVDASASVAPESRPHLGGSSSASGAERGGGGPLLPAAQAQDVPRRAGPGKVTPLSSAKPPRKHGAPARPALAPPR